MMAPKPLKFSTVVILPSNGLLPPAVGRGTFGRPGQLAQGQTGNAIYSPQTLWTVLGQCIIYYTTNHRNTSTPAVIGSFQNSALPLIYSIIPSIPDIRSNTYVGLIYHVNRPKAARTPIPVHLSLPKGLYILRPQCVASPSHNAR